MGTIPKRFLTIAATAALAGGAFLCLRSVNLSAPEAGIASPSSVKLAQRARDAAERWRREFKMLRDPKTGQIPADIGRKERAFAQTAAAAKRRAASVRVESRGPNNLGGRTRAVVVDISDPSGMTMLAGGVNAGVYRTVNGGASWVKTTPPDALHSVTAIAQDPSSPNVWYYGTGELQGTASVGSFLSGHGVWKSVDGGLTWSQLLATASASFENFDGFFDLVHRLIVDPATGDVYAAAHRSIHRSQDGGLTWAAVLSTQTPSSGLAGVTDVVVDSTGGIFYASFHGEVTDGFGGVWMSETGDQGSWTKIAGPGAALNPVDWLPNSGRTVLAIPPSQENTLYALYDNRHENDCAAGTEEKPEADLFLFDRDAQTWTNLSANLPNDPGCNAGNDPFAIQGGYDMAIAVSPLDPNIVAVGGTNLYVSTNGFRFPGAQRIGGYSSVNSFGLFPNHHPDIHDLRFDPFDPNTLLSGTDGGVHRTDINRVSWQSLNNDYVTYQYYHVAIAPQPGDDRAIGGAQDNGTTLTRAGGEHTTLFGGDGVAVGIGENIDSGGQSFETYYLGVQNGVLFRANNFGQIADIQPAPSRATQGLFVTYFLLDPDNTEFLYYANANRLFRTNQASRVNSGTWNELTAVATTISPDFNIWSMATTRGPYTPDSKLYIGDDNGRVFRLDNPQGASFNQPPQEITPPGASANAVVSGLAVDPSDDLTLMAVYANYNTPSVFITNDGGQTWQNVEGNLALPSIRSAAIVRAEDGPIFFVGTSVGLWRADAMNGADTLWTRAATDSIGLAVVSSLALRPADNRLLVGTHGLGMFILSLEDGQAPPSYAVTRHLTEVQTGAEGQDTLIAAVNPDPAQTTEVGLLAYDANGNLLAVSDSIGNLGPRQAARVSLKTAFPDHFAQTARVEIGSDRALNAFAELQQGDVARSAYRAAQRSSRLFMPHIAVDTVNFETVLNVANTEASALSFTARLLPPDNSFPLQSAARGRVRQTATQAFGAALTGAPALWAELDAGGATALAAVETFSRLPGRAQQAALDLNDQFGRELRFLHVAEDTARFWTGMLYINVGAGPANVVETYYDRNGVAIKTFDNPLAVFEKETLLFDAQNQDRVPAGTAWVSVRSDQDLIGYELFGAPVSSGNDYFAGLQGVYAGGSTLRYPYLLTGNNAFTGLVAVNIGEETADLTFTAYAADGTALESAPHTGAAAKTKVSILFRDLFQGQATLANAVWVEAVSTGSSWAGFMLWGDEAEPRQTLSGINAYVE